MRKRGNIPKTHSKMPAVPRLALTHGQTLWLLSELGFREGVSASTFNHYVKSLRKLGVPFERGKGQSRGRRHVTYEFEELMELSIALLLRILDPTRRYRRWTSGLSRGPSSHLPASIF
jgi:hypothetical protein